MKGETAPRKHKKGTHPDSGRVIPHRSAVYDVFREEIKALAVAKLSNKPFGQLSVGSIEDIPEIVDGTEPPPGTNRQLFQFVNQAITDFSASMTPEQTARVDEYKAHVEEHGRAVPLTK